ncbi:phage integrase family protein [Herbaspirillum sp. RV1423]|uniref:phage integrase family protein n=1 Tax=Herbaspirillum sp. RV1423 TaxID=1443993 RepID=UPI0004B27DF5|nr:phage integrase family protein [Herbaspirillum sp. RV1423]
MSPTTVDLPQITPTVADSAAPAPLLRVVLATPTPAPPTRRKLHLGHFAFMRALVQGLDTGASWDRYLRIEGERSDIRTVRRTIAWLRDEFAAAAQRHDRHGAARLVRMNLSTVVDLAPALPSLEDFAAERGMEDFSEAEQLEAFHEAYGADAGTQKQSRRARLIAKQLDVLRWLENLVAEPPRAGDGVGAWLHPDRAQRLIAAGVETLAQLVEHINGVGRGWTRRFKAIGAGKGEPILDWLRDHEITIGLSLASHVGQPRSKLNAVALRTVVPHQTGMVPIDKFIVPADLDGSAGRFRAPLGQCLMRANHDYDAILAFIRSKHGLTPDQRAALAKKRGIDPAVPAGPLDWLSMLSNTQRAYLKETERFLLWAILDRQLPLSSMTMEDCTAYRDFLSDPQPAATWCAPRGRERLKSGWRPFEGPLSPSAQRRTITILKTFYKFLVDQRYLIGNPWAGVSKPKPVHAELDVARSLTQAEWAFVNARLDKLAPTSANLRLRFGLRLLYRTGLRRSEVVAARVGDMKWETLPATDAGDPAVSGWLLRVVGKGGKIREVKISLSLAEDLARYLESRGLSPFVIDPANANAYMLGQAVDVAERAPWSPAGKRALAGQPVDPRAGIEASTLHDQIKGFFAECAGAMSAIDPTSAAQFGKASTHWLRHTRISHSLAAGTPIDIESKNAGHSSIGTTSLYTHIEKRRLLEGADKFWKSADRQ